jgi:hypothetical protein
VKLVRVSAEQWQFQLGKREKLLFFEVLKLYPCIPSAHQTLSKKGGLPEQETSQQLLDEALAEQRAEYKQQLDGWMHGAGKWTENEKGWRVTLSVPEIEWLLQVLNDIRVGSWVILGSPDPSVEEVNEHNAAHLWAMEVAGAFQTALLGALEHGSPDLHG